MANWNAALVLPLLAVAGCSDIQTPDRTSQGSPNSQVAGVWKGHVELKKEIHDGFIGLMECMALDIRSDGSLYIAKLKYPNGPIERRGSSKYRWLREGNRFVLLDPADQKDTFALYFRDNTTLVDPKNSDKNLTFVFVRS